MFANFNDTFKKKPLSETRIPDVVVEKLSESLPKGLRYIAGKNGDVVLISETETITLGGFTPVIPDEFKNVLGSKYTSNDVLQLSYNSQRPFHMKLAHEGYVTLNGKEVPFERLHYNIFHETKLVDNEIIAYPHTFPDPIEISVSTEDEKYSRKLMIKRVPYLSLTDSKLVSEEDQPLQVNFTSSTKRNGGTVNIKLELKNAKTIRDMVESIFVYNALCENKAKLGGQPFECGIPENCCKYDVKSAAFWQKALEVEEYLETRFAMPEGDTDYQTVSNIELLYRNLICNTAVRKNQRLTSVTGNFESYKKDAFKRAKEGNVYFQYRATLGFDIFGIHMDLPAICGLFNVAVSSLETVKGGKTKMELVDISTETPSYTSILCFKDEESMQEFVKNNGVNGENCADILEHAKTVNDYLDEE